jgi:hypothetical protein
MGVAPVNACYTDQICVLLVKRVTTMLLSVKRIFILLNVMRLAFCYRAVLG